MYEFYLLKFIDLDGQAYINYNMSLFNFCFSSLSVVRFIKGIIKKFWTGTLDGCAFKGALIDIFILKDRIVVYMNDVA